MILISALRQWISKKISKKWVPSIGYQMLHGLVFMGVCWMILDNASFAAPNIEGIQVYQKNLPPEHLQKLADDITRYRNADNLWDVLREDFALPHYEDNPAVQEKIEWFMNNQDYLLRSATRAAPYLYYILQQVKRRHLPAELVLLPIIESGYNPFAVSNVGATGIWQMMPDTASGLGVKQDWWFDGRRDVISSTRGALNYLAYLQTFFNGNWLLAIAAYNTGEGNVLSAIRRNIRDGRSTDFWSLPVAQQTKDYVPSLLALAVIISHPDQYPIYFPPVRNAPYLAQVDVGRQINLSSAAQLAGISFTKMKQLNPGFNRPAISSRGPTKLVLPIENVQQFTENLASSPLRSEINWIHYKVKSGDTLAIIAKRFSTTVAAIRKLNRLARNSALHHGYNLLIPYQGERPLMDNSPVEVTSDDETEVAAKTEKRPVTFAVAKNETPSADLNIKTNGRYALKPGDTIYMVRPHETLDRIARRFHLTQQALAAANDIRSHQLKAGTQLIIPTHINALAENNDTPSLSPGDTLYMVRHGDTIEKIAHKFHTTAAVIRLTNLVDNNSLTEGEKLVIPTHLRG